MSRYTIAFDGEHQAPDSELFPDGPETRTSLEDLLGAVTLREFLFGWLYAEDLRITVTDSETGERIEWDGSAFRVAVSS